MKNRLWIVLGITFFSFITSELTQAQPPEAGNINDVDHALVPSSATPPLSFLNRKYLPEALMIELMSFLLPIEITGLMKVDQEFYQWSHQPHFENIWIRFANAIYSSKDNLYYEKNPKFLNLILNRFFVRIQPLLESVRTRKKLKHPLPEVMSLIDLLKLYPYERSLLLRVICGANNYPGDRDKDDKTPTEINGRDWGLSLKGNEKLAEIDVLLEIRIFRQGPRLIPLLRYLGADPNARDSDAAFKFHSGDFPYRTAVHYLISWCPIRGVDDTLSALKQLSAKGGIDFYRKQINPSPNKAYSTHQPLLHYILESSLPREDQFKIINYLLSIKLNPLLSISLEGKLPSEAAKDYWIGFIPAKKNDKSQNHAHTWAIKEVLEEAEEKFRMITEIQKALEPSAEHSEEETKLPETVLSLTPLSIVL